MMDIKKILGQISELGNHLEGESWFHDLKIDEKIVVLKSTADAYQEIMSMEVGILGANKMLELQMEKWRK